MAELANALGLGPSGPQVPYRFKSCRPENAESHNGSVEVCKILGKGSIPFSALMKTHGQVAERLIAMVLKIIILSIVGSNPTLSMKLP